MTDHITTELVTAVARHAAETDEDHCPEHNPTREDQS